MNTRKTGPESPCPNAFDDLGRLETIKETMAHLALGRTKLYELISAGEIEVVKPTPRMTRVVSSSRRAYVQKLRASGP